MVNTFLNAISSQEAFKIATEEPRPQYVHLLNHNMESSALQIANGFQFSGIHAGIKKTNADLMLLKSSPLAVSAGVFTTNKVRATCVDYNEALVHSDKKIGAIVCNSGNANACTGKQGEIDNKLMAGYAQDALDLPSKSVLVASTGVIGQNLPMEKIKSGIEKSIPELSENGIYSASKAILTTDTFSKFLSLKVELSSGQTITLSAIGKGSGMICPNMATMLGFIITDADISKSLLQATLSELNQVTFNAISVDGDTSTNDMVLLLANGASGTPEITEDTEDYNRFKLALHYMMLVLAKLIVLDGEGATKFIELDIRGAQCQEDADLHAHTIAHSSLFKTAMFGEDANWGRILAAMGRSGAAIKPELVSIKFNDLEILKPNYEVVFDESEAKKRLLNRVINIEIDLGLGEANARFWTTDLSDKYIHINADYRT